jgi:hypothetical protein
MPTGSRWAHAIKHGSHADSRRMYRTQSVDGSGTGRGILTTMDEPGLRSDRQTECELHPLGQQGPSGVRYTY